MKLALCAFALVLAACSSSPQNFTDPPQGDDAGDGSTTPEATTPEAGPACSTYAAGPYGTGEGQTVSSGFSWKGYDANQTIQSTLVASDLYDCDGSKGINAIVFDISAGWCAACEAEAHDLATLLPQYESLGIRFITLMIQDASQAVATVDTAQAWRQQFNLADAAVYADPGFLFQPLHATTIGLPMSVVVDPRTMKIVGESQGYASAYPLQPNATAVATAKKNGAK